MIHGPLTRSSVSPTEISAAGRVGESASSGATLAADLEWGMLLATPDTRRDYGEQRLIGFAPIGERVYCVVFTDRGDERRMISLRKANSREVTRYVRAIEAP